MEDRTKPSDKQRVFALYLLSLLGDDETDVLDICGKYFDYLTRREIGMLIHDLLDELGV